MLSYLFLVIIFLFIAIQGVSFYKYFRLKKIKLAIFTMIYFIITLILTAIYFSTRNVITTDELTHLINGIKTYNIYAIIVVIINIGNIIIATINYIKVLKYSKEKEEKS